MIVALVAASVGTLGYSLGTVLQAWAASRAVGLQVMRQPTYLIGLGCDGVAWLASLLALQQLPLFAVQALLAGSIPVTVVLARVFLGAPRRRRDSVATVVVLGALVVVAAAAGPQSARTPPAGFTLLAVLGLAGLTVAVVALYRRAAPMLMATLAGLTFSGSALCARVVHPSGSVPQLVHQPPVVAALGFGVLGAVTFSRSLEEGPVGAVTSIVWVLEVLIPGAVGVLELGDTVRPGWTWSALGALTMALAGCVVLATRPAGRSTYAAEAGRTGSHGQSLRV